MTAIMNRYQKRMEAMRDENPFLSSTELVYRLILEDIVSHHIAPGQKLNQEQLADDMKVSRTPVREALQQLERENYIVKGAQGYSVYEMKIGDYMALLDVRIAVEKLAAELACSRILGSELKKIEQNLKETERLLESGRGSAWDDDYNILDSKEARKLFAALGRCDQAFHVLVIQAAHNVYLTEVYREMIPRIQFFRYSALTVNACLNMMERHRKIYEAIAARDEELAKARMKKHLELTVNRAMRY